MEHQNEYRVIVSERATQMFVSHAAFLAQVSTEAAERLTAEFEKIRNYTESMFFGVSLRQFTFLSLPAAWRLPCILLSVPTSARKP